MSLPTKPSTLARALALGLLTIFVLLISLGSLPRLAAQPAEPVQVNAEANVLIIYGDDTAIASAVAALLEPDGYEVDLMALIDEGPPVTWMPIVVAQMGGSATARAAASNHLSDVDIFIIADDTDGAWSTQPTLIQEIAASGKPVVAIGRGGHEFLGELDLPNGGPASTQGGNRLFASDVPASLPLYSGPHPVALDAQDSVQVIDSGGTAVALSIAAQPELLRIGALSASGPQAVVQAQERYTLWGFTNEPDALTDAGADLFRNIVYGGVAELALPIKGAGFIPGAGVEQGLLDALAGGDPVYALAQLTRVPTPQEREALEASGVELLTFLAGEYYHALVQPGLDPDDPTIMELVRWLGLLPEGLKIDPELVPGNQQRLAQNDITTMLVTFHDDVPAEEAERLLAGIVDDFAYYSDHTYQTAIDPGALEALAALPQVRWIGTGPVPPQDTNNGGRASTGTDMVTNPVTPLPATGPLTYLGLTGAGVTVGHFEDKSDTSHVDLAGNVSISGAASGSSDSHATHVAGIIGGTGADSSNQGGSNRQWRGHAPEVDIVSVDYGTSSGSAVNDNFSVAILDNDVEVSNHSYVMATGEYDGAAQAVDDLVHGTATDSDGDTIPARLAVWAAANQGASAQYDNEEGFYSIYSPAKNSLTVGSVDSNDNEYSMFSSKGPTFDGRLKPDVMAPGCQNGGDLGITSTEIGGGYVVKCGTSMAAPATTGVIALMLEQYHQTFGPSAMPRPATIKAILVNTATDMVHTASDGSDTNDRDLCRNQGPGGGALGPGDPLDPQCWTRYGPGPDFATGYGLINAPAAVNAVRGKLFFEDSLGPGDTTDTFTFEVAGGRPELRVTLAYDDEPGDSSLSNTTGQLVNDLDLRLIGPDGTHFPFVLAPLPANANLGNGGLDPINQAHLVNAPTGDDDRNNVEQVVVENPDAGTWTVQVTVEGGFPTGNPQPYSIAGDFRSFTVIQPTTATPADGGEENDPASFLIILEAQQAHVTGAPDNTSTFAGSQPGDFEVRIAGTDADVISGSVVGDQYWLVARPASGVYSPGYYNLRVVWTGYGFQVVTDGVVMLENRTADRVIIVDHSGSMIDYDKMQAAQNAGRLFVDLAQEDDRVAVVGFSTTATSPYPIDVVSAGANPPELTAAKNAIDSLSPTNQTAIGLGLLQGKGEIDTPGGSSVIRRMVLLSDGMENVSPYYNSPAVKGVIQPTDIIVDTVAVGPADAGMHSLLETIASDNGGIDYHVTETGFGGTRAADATTVDEWLLPATLENRLADQYKDIAEEILREQRLWQVSGEMDEGIDREAFEVYVDEDLASMTAAINWNTPNGEMRMELRSPSGRTYAPGDPDVVYRSDNTHETWTILKPEGGFWSVLLVNQKAQTEYVAWISAHTRVSFDIYVTTPPDERVTGNSIHILALLHDSKPITGANVLARVYGPDDSTWELNLVLYDDGNHGDGMAGDGLYGNWYLGGDLPGNYALRGRADGTSNAGQMFLRYANGTFFMRPRALYVHDGDRETAAQVEALLEGHNWGVDVYPVADVPGLPLAQLEGYSLVVIGPETGNLGSWGTDAAQGLLAKIRRPTLGLGEGGYAYFGKQNLAIGYPNGAHGSGNAILPRRTTESIWEYPYDLTPPGETLKLYEEDVGVVGIFTNGQEPGGTRIYGLQALDDRYADLMQQLRFGMLWGFGGPPELMTDAGRQLLVNTAAFTAFGPRP